MQNSTQLTCSLAVMCFIEALAMYICNKNKNKKEGIKTRDERDEIKTRKKAGDNHLIFR